MVCQHGTEATLAPRPSDYLIEANEIRHMMGIPFTSATLAIICSTYVLLQDRASEPHNRASYYTQPILTEAERSILYVTHTIVCP
jgi:hypothetical protein